MTNDVNNETEETKTGESSVVEQKQDAAAQTPVQAAEENPNGTPEQAPIAAESPADIPEEAQPAPTADGTRTFVSASDSESADTNVRVPNEVPAATAGAPDEPEKSGEIDFGSILEQFEQEQTVYHAGELVEGKVVGVSERGVLVDFGYKSEGVIPIEENAAVEHNLNVGDTIEAVIKSIHAGDAPPVLSISEAKGRKIWNDIEEAYKNDVPVTGRIVDKTKGGLKVDLNGIEAFLPGSQIDSRPIRGLDTYIGQDIEAKIIKFSRRRNNIVLSRKVITDVVINEEKQKTLGVIDVGHILDGTIKNLTEYGAFVDIGGIDGLLHVTDMSWGRLGNPAEQFKVGEQMQVKVLKLDREKEKISLGYKQLLPDPWSTVTEVYTVNSRHRGKVSSVTEYGIFVELEPGVEGLVHVSEISWSKRSASPKRGFHRGGEVDVQVLGVDTVEKRISLGMKQMQDNPWDTINARYPVGTKIHGRVRNLTDFGAFVELEEGIDGLVHVSDITWAKKLKHPKELLKKDQEVDAVVTNIDAGNQRLSLSMKDLTPSSWEGFVATHRPGDVVRGKVSRFTSFGVFVELGEGLEGLCHISELSDERVEKPEDVAKLGQEMDFKILRIENADQKIGLSHRAVGKEDEPVVDSRVYSTEAKGGMASLGELANLGKGGAAEEEPKAELSKEEKEEAKKEKKDRARKEYEDAEAAKEAAAAQSEPAAEETATEAPATNGESAETSEAEPVAEVTDGESAVTAESAAPDASGEAASPTTETSAPEIAQETTPKDSESAADLLSEPRAVATGDSENEGAADLLSEPRAVATGDSEASEDLLSEPRAVATGDSESETPEEAAANDPESAAADTTPAKADANPLSSETGDSENETKPTEETEQKSA